MLIGLISDTHGLLRPAALKKLQGSDLIVHAGDVGRQDILDELRGVAPLTVVRGNVDRDPWADELPESYVLEVESKKLLVLHDLSSLHAGVLDNVDAVIYGHSHTPLIRREGAVLYVNPGSAGPRRFKLPVSLGLLRIEAGRLGAQLLELEV
jgi:putative phosphoesterase